MTPPPTLHPDAAKIRRRPIPLDDLQAAFGAGQWEPR